MVQNRHQRAWLLVAIFAIAVALVLMLVPHAHSGHVDVWLAVLPILFIGVIWPFRLLQALEYLDLACISDAPALQPTFQRPPPFRLA